MLAMIAGCTTARINTVDTTDPEQVAIAFIKAVAKKDVNSAIVFVSPNEREAIEKAMSQMLPPWPKNPKIKLMLNGDSAQVLIENSKVPGGMDMIMKNDQWWIVM